MSNKPKNQGERRLRVRGIRRDPPDLKKLASAIIELAKAQAEAEAAAEHERTQRQQTRAKHDRKNKDDAERA